MIRRKLKVPAILAGCMFAACLTGCAAGLPKAGVAVVEVTTESLQAEQATTTVKTLEAEACNYSVLGLVSVGDASIEAAAQKVNIKQITEMSRNLMGLNFWYLKIAKNCTVVKGTN